MTNHLKTLAFVVILGLSGNAPGFAQGDSPQEKAARIAAEGARRQQEEAAGNARRQAEEARRAAEQDQARLKALYPLTPLSVQIVISRFKGETKISSLPYMLSVNANSLRWGGKPALLRMGGQIPIPGAPPATVDGKPSANYGGPVQYKDIGTSIDASATSVEGGRFQLNISIEDASIYPDDPTIDSGPRVRNMPVFRSFRTSNELILGSGQSAQFTAATDKVTGEITKIDVTLSVLK